jgi:hypothetical protein
MSNKCINYNIDNNYNPMGNMLPFDNRARAPACGTVDMFNSVARYKVLKPDYNEKIIPVDMAQSMPIKPANPYNPEINTFYYGEQNITTEPINTPSSMRFGDTLSHIFYTNPVTTSAPDTVEFARFLFPDPARCRNTGYLCKTNVDTTINHDRMGYFPNETYYQTINTNYNNNSMYNVGGHLNGMLLNK